MAINIANKYSEKVAGRIREMSMVLNYTGKEKEEPVKYTDTLKDEDGNIKEFFV